MVGGVETGGTKIVCAVGNGPDDLELTSFPTTEPAETIGRIAAFFAGRAVEAVGIGSFGPIDPDPQSPKYGYITATPKPGWRNVDLVGPIQKALNVPVAFDTDVNAAALAEAKWGAGRGIQNLLYVTVGTGIGAGALVNGRPIHGLIHPEMGHVRIPRDPAKDPFTGSCPFHGDCLEGLASGPAIEQRLGVRGETLPDDHHVWTLVAHYVALGLMNWTLTLSPQRIVLGGGVLANPRLLPMIRSQLQLELNGYLEHPALLEHIDQFVVAPGLGARAGVLGAVALALSRVG